MRLLLLLGLAVGLAGLIYHQFIAPPKAPLTVQLIEPTPAVSEELSEVLARLPSASPPTEAVEDQMPEPDRFEAIDAMAIANPATQQVISDMLKQAAHDLDTGVYDEVGTLSYNIVYLFLQSLAAYERFLKNPDDGPDFHVLSHRRFSGRYNFQSHTIFMGRPTLGDKEGRFLTTLFHEFQHYIFHSIYGTPKRTDIVRKFYNELAAFLFESLFAVYLPEHYFMRPHRRGMPDRIHIQLKNGNGLRAIDMSLDMMTRMRRSRPIYRFLMPVWDLYIGKEEILAAIDETFHPEADAADRLEAIAADYWSDRAHGQ